jgi:hypothetical protein
MNFCKFKKLYNEPKEEYICMALSLFLPLEYKKIVYGKELNVRNKKHKMYHHNLNKIITNLNNNFYPKNFYLRIYIDNSILTNDPKFSFWKPFFKKIKNNKKIQIIKYECPNYQQHGIHHNVFGMIVRFHCMFDKNSNSIINTVIDADQNHTKQWINTILDFNKSNKDFHIYSGVVDCPLHRNDFNYYSDDITESYYIRGCCLSSKIKFGLDKWEKIPDIILSFDFYKILNFDDFKKFTLYKSNKNNTSFHEYIYGFDEILINFIVKDEIKKNKYTVMETPTFNKNFINNFLIPKIIDYLNYSEKTLSFYFEKFLTKIHKTKDELYKELQSITTIDELQKIMKLFLKKFKYLEKLYMQSAFFYFILHHEKILKKHSNANPLEYYIKAY